MEDHWVVDVTDLQSVRFVCTACGAAVTIRTAAFKDLQARCPGCDVQWSIPGSLEEKALRAMMRSLHDLAAAAKTAPIRVCFDLTTEK